MGSPNLLYRRRLSSWYGRGSSELIEENEQHSLLQV